MIADRDKRDKDKIDEEKRNNYPKSENADAENNDNFIMFPTVDFCFKELMKNPKVRKGFVAAILGKEPETVRRTTVIETELRKESEDDKLGILDVLVELEDGVKMNMEMQVPYFEYWANRVLFYVSKIYTGQIQKGDDYDKLQKCIHVSILDFIHFPQDQRCYRKITLCDVETGEQYTDLMELHVLELKKLPPEDQNEDGVIRWMRFLGGKSRKEFEDMAEKDEYIKEAYEDLKKLSLDEQKRLEYEVRQRAIRDHNSQMKSAERRGIEIGEERGEKRGIEIGTQSTLKRLVKANVESGKSLEEIAEFLGLDLSEVEKMSKE
ncbi:MAG TPA: Rpn family recombination-promoting nuclease/putative transposase [Candidatus Mediterraneibacter surreyensis]|nr:Rpn family recombination-promoting nuclease/putative transposase [Candidatus Mediterraneibacter surreyensis]